MELLLQAAPIIAPIVTAIMGWLTPKQSKKVQQAGKASSTTLKESAEVMNNIADGKIDPQEAKSMANKAKDTYEWAKEQFGEDDDEKD